MSDTPRSRREFLKSAAIAGVGLGLGSTLLGNAAVAAGAAGAPITTSSRGDVSATRRRPAGQKPVHDLTTTPLEKVRAALIGCGGRGSSLHGNLLDTGFVEIVAVCDLITSRAERCAAAAKKHGFDPKVFGGALDAWEAVCGLDNVDVVYIATPWEWHAPMAVKSMESGKHAFVEVPACVTVDECWQLVDTSERTQRHCVILENCCYGPEELFVLNLVRKGILGELNHAECAYIHDLRSTLFETEGEGAWRRNFHTLLDANLYPTHGLGPVAQYLGINRGDQFRHLVSMSSPERGLTKFRNEKRPQGGRFAGEKYRCGDMNTTLIKTEAGRSIMVQHDVISPRPYSRINGVSGTGGTFFGYPARLAVNDGSSHSWMSAERLKEMREKYEHPLWAKLAAAAKASGGHGGMDYVMNWRLCDCLRRGATPDITVYDAAAWSCIIELSAKSVAGGSLSVAVPDFTRGLWKTLDPLGIAG